MLCDLENITLPVRFLGFFNPKSQDFEFKILGKHGFLEHTWKGLRGDKLFQLNRRVVPRRLAGVSGDLRGLSRVEQRLSLGGASLDQVPGSGVTWPLALPTNESPSPRQ